MLTLFSSLKPFRGQFQGNAARSWARLTPAPEILLSDDPEGTAEIAAEIGARHLPELRRPRRGAPLINEIFATAAPVASHPTLCYVNGDIILGDDLPAALASLPLSSYLLVGQQTDLDLTEPLRRLFFIGDATHRLMERGLVRDRRTPSSRRLDTLANLNPRWGRPLRLASRSLAAAGRLLGGRRR